MDATEMYVKVDGEVTTLKDAISDIACDGKFDEFLDEYNDVVEVAGYDFAPSEVLCALGPCSYEYEMDKYIEDSIESTINGNELLGLGSEITLYDPNSNEIGKAVVCDCNGETNPPTIINIPSDAKYEANKDSHSICVKFTMDEKPVEINLDINPIVNTYFF